MKNDYKISVIICTFGLAKYLKKTIKALAGQTYHDFEIVLVDNNPNAVNFDMVFKNLDVYHKIVRAPILGLSIARNVGIKNSRGEYIFFLDDDAVPDRKWLENIIRGFDTYNSDMIGGRVDLKIREIPRWFTKLCRLYLSELTYYNKDVELIVPPRYVVGTNMAFKAETFKKYGLFYPKSGRIGNKLISLEDVEMVRRIYYSGGKISFVNSAKMIHIIPRYRTRIRYLFKRAFWQGISDVMLEKIQPLKKIKPKKLSLGFDFLLETFRYLGKSWCASNFKIHNNGKV